MITTVTLLAAVLQLPVGPALPPDSVRELQRRARRTEGRYEALARRLAPFSFSSHDAPCDEIVGRFCLRFDSVTPAPAARPEQRSVQDARAEAVEAYRRFFAVSPGTRAAAGPLVRLLIQDGRAREALSSADAFAALSADTTWALLLQGMAFHAAGEPESAEGRFQAALERLEPAERARWLDLTWLVDPAERRALEPLAESARAEYARRFWLVADPFWLTPVNEHWVEHIARHIEARLLAEVPLVTGMMRWGRDLDELTVRYGTPTERRRTQPSLPMDRPGMVEYYDTAQRAYAPARLLLTGIAEPPLPGARPLLYSARTRVGYAMAAFTRVLELDHQASRFLDAGSVVLRVDAALRADSVAAGAADAGLVVMDSALTLRSEVRARPQWRGDSTRFTLRLRVPPGPFIYSVELVDRAADAAARARYALTATLPDAGPMLSDLLITAPFSDAIPARHDDPALQPLTSLIVTRGDTLGIYAEAYGLARGATPVAVELAMERAEPSSLTGRFADWIGRSTGLLPPRREARVGWQASPDADVHTLALNLPLDERRTGLQTLVLKVTDPMTGRSAETRRTVLIRSR